MRIKSEIQVAPFKKRFCLNYLTGLALLALVFTVSIPLSAYGVDGQIKIAQPASFPIIIDQPGSYVLTCNITTAITNVNCFEIDTDNVTLDLNGHALIGPGKENGSSGSGIYVNNRNNIAIINGVVRDFREYGINLTGTGTNHQLKDIRIYSNGLHGISATYSTITNCTASYNGSHGIYSSDSSITNCTVSHNGFHGFSVTSSTTISNCTATYNSSHGFYVSNSTVVNCTANNNSGRGIYASSSTITNCTANNNESHGIYASSECRIEGNNLRSNEGYGLYLSSSYNYAIKNTASANNSGNFYAVSNNYMPTSGDNANYGW